MIAPFSPRSFLRSRGAVLVHFSTIMSSHPDLLYPADLLNALRLGGVPLSFSTIQCGDTNPWGNGRGGAEGSIGILVDIGPGTAIHSVSPHDSGSSAIGSLGFDPTPEACADSIDQRETSNEWRIADYVPVGIFILPPIFVNQAQTIEGLHEPILAELGLSFEQAIAPFPDQRILSANARTFIDFDRAAQEWKAIAYDDIIRPNTSADTKIESIGPGGSAEDRPIG